MVGGNGGVGRGVWVDVGNGVGVGRGVWVAVGNGVGVGMGVWVAVGNGVGVLKFWYCSVRATIVPWISIILTF